MRNRYTTIKCLQLKAPANVQGFNIDSVLFQFAFADIFHLSWL